MRDLKLTIEYEGGAYVGWQRQRQPNSVQQVVEEAIAAVVHEDVRLHAASRTDAGVHARGQVAGLRIASALPCERLRDAVNAHLPRDIAVRRVEEAPDGFHARFSARAKLYEYSLATGPVRPVVDRRTCWYVRAALDPDAMRRAAAAFVGEHDFAAFGAEVFRRKTTVRTIYLLELDEPAPDRLRFRVRGDGFLYNMVRSIVGTLVDVGRGKIAPDEVAAILAARDRGRVGRTAPAHGLCLVRVHYGDGGESDA